MEYRGHTRTGPSHGRHSPERGGADHDGALAERSMGPGPLVEREDDSPALPRAVRERGGSAGGDHAGSGSLARGVRPGEAVQDRHAPAACRAPRRPAARRRSSACRWRWTGSTRAAGSTGRPLELLIADYESKPDVGRRKAEKLVVDDQIDAHAGGYLSNVCLACMPVYEENKVVNMITVCLDTTITTTKCSRYTFRPFDYAPAQAVAAAPYLVEQDRQAVAHRLCRLRVGPVHARRLRRADQGRAAARSSRRRASRSARPT